MTALSLQRLSLAQARDLTEEVKADATALWAKLLALYEGEAHIALGYSSWGDYYAEEFGQERTRGYRILDAARVVAQLPMGNSEVPNERVARELVPVLREDPEQVEEVWGEVVEQHGPAPTAAQVRDVVAAHREPEEEPVSSSPPLTKRQTDQANAARERVTNALHTLDGMCVGLAQTDIERATATTTSEEIRAWNKTVDRAVSQLHVFQKALTGLGG